jgi:hypothetical protein
MNLERHQRIGDAPRGGVDELRAAFERLGQPDVRFQAFALGNWLADVSQMVDVALRPEKLKAAVRDALTGVARAVQVAAPGPGIAFDRALRRAVDVTSRELSEGIDWLLEPTGDSHRNIRLYDHARDGFRFAGYFKFVHPDQPGGRSRMDFEAYRAIFDDTRLVSESRPVPFEAGFTEYYPHEHLDRPSKPDVDTRRGSRSGMYAYLEDDFSILAGTWSRVEQEWAQPTFGSNAPVDDADVAWNLRLARFGKSMHMAEDLYAHSNFTELAAAMLGPAFLSGAVTTERHRRIYLRRTRRWPPSGTPEPNLVTGYFSELDFNVGVAHALEELLGLRFADPERDMRRIGSELARDPVGFLKREPQRMLVDVGEMVADPAAAFRDPANATARYLHVRHSELVETILAEVEQPGRTVRDIGDVVALKQAVSRTTLDALLTDGDLWHDVPPDVRVWFASAIRWLGTVRRVGNAARSVFEIVELIGALYTSLERAARALLFWIRWYRSDVIGLSPGLRSLAISVGVPMVGAHVVLDPLARVARGAIVAAARQRFYDALDADRIGSHSLLAKDYDDSDPFAEHALHLATGMHWYVVSTMVRPDARGRPTDWLDLAYAFLGHPGANRHDRWWASTMERRDWLARPGGTRGFPPRYGHSRRFVTPVQRDRLIAKADLLRAAAEHSHVMR